MMNLSEKEWQARLTPEQFKVLRQRGTEPPFSGKYYKHNKKGEYKCAACGAVLFKSNDKYDSDQPGLAGWPSFSELADAGAVKFKDDYDLGARRTEVVCANCGSHLGHVFDDEESKTGKHYCINSCALEFQNSSKNT